MREFRVDVVDVSLGADFVAVSLSAFGRWLQFCCLRCVVSGLRARTLSADRAMVLMQRAKK